MTIGVVGKTITLTLHRDKCDPGKWTVAEWKLFADFVKDGSLQRAASLARLGLQVRLDDRHTPTGGELEHTGWARPDDLSEVADDLTDLDMEHGEVSEVCRIYRGPTVYVVPYAVGQDNEVEGYEHELFDRIGEAERYAKSMAEEPAETAEDTDATQPMEGAP